MMTPETIHDREVRQAAVADILLRGMLLKQAGGKEKSLKISAAIRLASSALEILFHAGGGQECMQLAANWAADAVKANPEGEANSAAWVGNFLLAYCTTIGSSANYLEILGADTILKFEDEPAEVPN